MPVRDTETPFPVIDTDPHFFRVVRYFRPSDYAAWASLTAAAPAVFYSIEKLNPAGGRLRGSLGLATLFGAVGGFFLAYQSSSFRFWGFQENAQEVKKDNEEMRLRLNNGLPLYGETQLSPYLQGVSARNSRFSALKFSAIPWFNVANHQYHGVDPSKYELEETSASE